MKLSEIADIYAGYLFRSRIEQANNGSYQVIQMRGVTQDSNIDWRNLTRVDLDSVKSVFVVEKGDILFKAKGSSHTAILVDRTEDKTIASSFFFIIRVKSANVVPEYIAWYINQPTGQQHFTRTAAGTGIRYVNRKNLGDLDIVVPDLNMQKKIVELSRLGRREKQLVSQIQGKRQVLVNAIMLDTVKHQNIKI